jgi:hypothetical protein
MSKLIELKILYLIIKTCPANIKRSNPKHRCLEYNFQNSEVREGDNLVSTLIINIALKIEALSLYVVKQLYS